MSELNKEVVRKGIDEIWNKANSAVLNQTHTPDYIHRGNEFPETTGVDALKQFVLALRSAFPDGRFTIENLVSEADTVVVRWRFTGTHQGEWLGVPATGRPVNFTGTSIERFEGDRMAEQISADWDAMGVWRQLGLVSDPAVLEANKALVRRYMETVWNEGKLDVVDEIFTVDSHFRAPHSAEFRGLQARKEFVAGLRAAFPDVRYTVGDLLADGNKVALHWSFKGTHSGEWFGAIPTGNVVLTSGTSTFEFIEGRIHEELVEWDSLGYMQQIGVVPALV